MTTKLSKMKIKEVSLVTRPAIAREFLLYKSEDGAMEVPVVEEIVKTEEPVVEAPVEVPAEPEKPAIDTQKSEEPAVVEAEVAKEVKCPECGQVIDEEEAKKMEEGKPCKACGEKKVKKEWTASGGIVEKPVEVIVPIGDLLVTKQLEDISKALEQEKLEKAAVMAELAELKKAAEIEKEAKITKEFIEKAATELKNIPTLVPASFGPVLKAASYKLEKSEFDALYGALQAASVFIAKNAMLTKELGVGGEDLSADPAAQLDAIAKSYVSKDAKLTYAKAYEMAAMNNPAVYAQHVRQARGE